MSVLWLARLVAGLSPQMPRFYPNPRGICGEIIDDVETYSSEFFGFHFLVSFH